MSCIQLRWPEGLEKVEEFVLFPQKVIHSYPKDSYDYLISFDNSLSRLPKIKLFYGSKNNPVLSEI